MDTRTYDIDGFTEELVAHGLIIPTGVPGAYGRGPVFEDILRRFDALVVREAAPDGAQELTFPPILARRLIEQLGYLDNFPQLAGSVHSFTGSDREARELSERVHAGERWEDLLSPTEVMLTPAACYPVYPTFSGLLPQGGRLVTIMNWVFRHEPSPEPTRLQHFRMREYIRVGRPEDVQAWRDAWLQRGLELLGRLKLPVASDVASDPFFGRAGRMMAASQVDQRLKFEILCPVISREKPTAICSFNWHQEHFTSRFGIRQHDGGVAHTACLGFGLERVTLALVKTHGYDPADWPRDVRSLLWNDA
ncbi:amino acid--[acyl-carrier-protein] ligase [Ramlibacter sp. AW1]|uniref:Amino acid--[acyl-carrier-protein] ligase n=1 Tax=Ramlibacter aurantiacus TaxID=2801330 RepID=A0A937D0E5_9BURK|nr:amino acid--[acyl-carrier-protein] ligase [Ramlibacter aurantiacus]MBL0419344.1 amino acid--[acyl-carrier-protein] ligase [Ramlibacter aurantiacus]